MLQPSAPPHGPQGNDPDGARPDYQQGIGVAPATTGAAAEHTQVRAQFARFTDDLARAVVADELRPRIEHTQFSVTISVLEHPGLRLAVRAHDGRAAVESGNSFPTHAEFTIDPGQLPTIWQRQLSAYVLAGHAEHRGPVRELLRIWPIIRAWVRDNPA